VGLNARRRDKTLKGLALLGNRWLPGPAYPAWLLGHDQTKAIIASPLGQVRPRLRIVRAYLRISGCGIALGYAEMGHAANALTRYFV
jgi:hypothetical protein